MQHTVGQAIGVIHSTVDHDQSPRTGQRIGADLERRSGQQHRVGISRSLLKGDAAQPIMKVGLVGVADVIDPLNADHGMKIVGADRDRASGVVVDGESGRSHGLGDRVGSQ